MKTTIIFASAVLALCAASASAQPYRGDGRGDMIPMRDGSTIVTVGGCLVQYGGRGERINNAQRCNDGDIREADRMMSGGGRPGYGGGPNYGGGPGYGGGAPVSRDGPNGNWAQSCRNGQMQGPTFTAECRNEGGRWNTTVLDMRNCPTGTAENRNGSLVCR